MPPTHFIWRRDSSQSSSQPKKRGPTGAHSGEHDFLVVSYLEQWLSRLNERPWGPWVFLGHSLRCPHGRQSRALDLFGPGAPDVQNINHSTGVNSRYRGIWISKQRQSLILGHSGLELDSLPSSSLSLQDLKELCDDTLTPILCGFHAGWQFWPTGRKLMYRQGILPWTVSFTNTWVNQSIVPCQRLGCMQGNFLLQWATLGSNILAEYYYVVVKRFWVLRGSY